MCGGEGGGGQPTGCMYASCWLQSMHVKHTCLCTRLGLCPTHAVIGHLIVPCFSHRVRLSRYSPGLPCRTTPLLHSLFLAAASPLCSAVTFVALGNGAPDLSANIAAISAGEVVLSAGAFTGAAMFVQVRPWAGKCTHTEAVQLAHWPQHHPVDPVAGNRAPVLGAACQQGPIPRVSGCAVLYAGYSQHVSSPAADRPPDIKSGCPASSVVLHVLCSS